MTFTGTLANVNTALNGLSFLPTLNFNGAASLSITSNDQGNTGSGGALTDTDNVAITVNAVNDAPGEHRAGRPDHEHRRAQVLSTGNGNLISVADVDAAPDRFRSRSASRTARSACRGTTGLTFTAGDGTADAAMTFTGTLTNINAALNGLDYLPTLDYDGPDTLAVTTSDLGHTGSGGTLTDSDSVAITVVNPPPIADPDSFTARRSGTRSSPSASRRRPPAPSSRSPGTSSRTTRIRTTRPRSPPGRSRRSRPRTAAP